MTSLGSALIQTPVALLAAENLVVKRGRRTLLHDFALAISPGQRWAVVGPSGGGKTSLLRALARLDPAQGRLFLRGQPADEVAVPAWRAAVTWLAAETPFRPATIRDTLEAPHRFAAVRPDFDPDAARRRLSDLGLDGLGWTDETETLSAGQRQRLALARALSIEPTVLLADEPTAHLDAATRDRVVSVLTAWVDEGERALVVVAHDEALVSALEAQVIEVGTS